MADSWSGYKNSVKDKLKNSKVIENAIRNMKARGHEKEYAQRISGAPYEVVDRIYKDKRPHDTNQRQGDDD